MLCEPLGATVRIEAGLSGKIRHWTEFLMRG
jgi:hypothetical protein